MPQNISKLSSTSALARAEGTKKSTEKTRLKHHDARRSEFAQKLNTHRHAELTERGDRRADYMQAQHLGELERSEIDPKQAVERQSIEEEREESSLNVVEEELVTPPDDVDVHNFECVQPTAPRVEPEQAEVTPPRPDRAACAQIAEQLVKACHIGHDERARKIMLLDVEVPGKGALRIRLTREGDGVKLRCRASDDGVKTWLKAHRGTLRDHAARQGVVFTHIEVV